MFPCLFSSSQFCALRSHSLISSILSTGRSIFYPHEINPNAKTMQNIASNYNMLAYILANSIRALNAEFYNQDVGIDLKTTYRSRTKDASWIYKEISSFKNEIEMVCKFNLRLKNIERRVVFLIRPHTCFYTTTRIGI